MPEAPASGGDDQARGGAVEPRVVGEHGRNVVGVVSYLRIAPASRYHDHRRQVAKLSRKRLVQDRLVTPASLVPLRARAKDDHLVGAIGASDLELVATRVIE